MGQWQGIAILMAILMILVIIPSTPPEEIENSRFVPDIPIPSHPPCPLEVIVPKSILVPTNKPRPHLNLRRTGPPRAPIE